MSKNDEPICGVWYWVRVEEDYDWIPARYMGDCWLVNDTPVSNVHDRVPIFPQNKMAKFNTVTILPKGVLVVMPTSGRRLTEEESDQMRYVMKKLLGNVEVVVFNADLNFTAVNPPE